MYDVMEPGVTPPNQTAETSEGSCDLNWISQWIYMNHNINITMHQYITTDIVHIKYIVLTLQIHT